MHKVQINSSSFDPESVKKRISHFDEFDNGHVLFSYSKMSVADSEEKAKQASIKHPDDVYYVSYDDLMNSCSDTYWFQGVAYDNKGAWKALREYRKAQAAGLNSGRRPIDSSEEQVNISGIVTIYSDFVDFKQSVSEHLLQTAVGDRAKLKFKWLGNNKVEVRAICAASDERKVKILLENSDVTKTIAWATSGNSGRRRQLGLNSGCGDLVKKSTTTLKRKLKDASPEEKKAILAELNARGVYPKTSVNSAENSPVGPCFVDLWSAYIDDEYRCACCGKPFPAGHGSVQLGGHKPDGMHFIYEYTKENRIGNSVNYDPYNLPPEDKTGGIFKVIVGEEADDEGYRWLNFCRNCWPKLTSMSPEEIYARYSPDAKAGLNSSHKPAKRATRKKLNSSKKSEIMELTGWSPDDLADAFDEWLANGGDEYEEDEQFDAFADAVAEAAELGDTDAFGIPLKASRKMNSSRKVGNNSMRKVIFRGKLNSSRNRMNSSRRKLNSSLVGTFLQYHDDADNYRHQSMNYDALYDMLNAYAKPGENPEDMDVDKLFERAPETEQRAMIALIDPKNWGGASSRNRMNSSRRINSSRRKLNSSEDDITADDDVQDTGIDGGDTATETAELLDDALIVQNPETKEVSLFVATEDDEVLPESVDVIAEVTPVVEGAVLDSSRRLKRFAAAKLNSSKGCLNSEAEDVCPACGNPVAECTCEPGTVAYDEIQLPDDTVVEVENILVVQGEDDDLGLFMPETADEAVPDEYEVVAVATPVAETEVLDSSRRLKKAGKKLNR